MTKTVYYLLYRMKNSQRGFTLIELLVVISIIGFMASIMLFAIKTARLRGQLARMKVDAHNVMSSVNIARTNTVLALTGNSCSACAFNTTASVNSQIAALASLNASWQTLGFNSSPMDPWKRPYLLDENEGQNPAEQCRYDVVLSAGQNGIWEGWGTFNNGLNSTMVPGIIYPTGAGDDYVFVLNFGGCSTPN